MKLQLSVENKAILIKRLKSLVWRAGGMVAIMAINFLAENLSLFDLPPQVVVLLGLVLGEVTKWLNVNKAEPVAPPQ